MKILLVEDEELIRQIVVDALENEGFEVIEAATGEEALPYAGLTRLAA